jgi:organic radical activating enzyme
MKIHNVRAGFATNSSSSHSIVMIPKGQSECSDEYERYSYNWEQFVLADTNSKQAYFLTQMYVALQNSDLNHDEIVHVMQGVLGSDVDLSDFPSDAVVDHQSQWHGMTESMQHTPDLVRAMWAFVQRDDVVILGGNDNGGDQQAPPNSWEDDCTRMFSQYGDRRVRQDGDHWVLFNQRSGTKMRMSFDAHSAPYVKSSVPELVDLKITNYCAYGCVFCYQSSTKAGVHADLNHIKQILNTLGTQGVFEVAIGGGEPTHYPHLAEVLTYAAEQQIVPNFTTYEVDWLQNQELTDAVRAHVGAIGVSVHGVKDLNKVKKINEALNFNTHRWDDRYVHVTAQHVVGSVDMDETAQILERAWQEGWDLLLLGYKNVGFGASQAPHDLTGLDTLLKLRQQKRAHYGAKVSMLGVDTAFVQQFDPILDALGISPVLKTSEEGKFSMYIDSVTLMQGPSSYMPDQMIPLDITDCDASMRSAYVTW